MKRHARGSRDKGIIITIINSVHVNVTVFGYVCVYILAPTLWTTLP